MRLNVPILSGIKAVALLHRQTPALNTRCAEALRTWISQHFPFLGPDSGVGIQVEWAGYVASIKALLRLC